MVNSTGVRQLELLTTSECSLCEQAMDLLLANVSLAGWQLQALDIAYHDDLLQRFGSEIPVLRYQDRLLKWPFTPGQVQAWLDQAI